MGSGSKKQTAGYRYSMGLHFGICHGPIDKLLRIIVGERSAWAGEQTANGSLSVNVPSLFGGDEREGGLVGSAHVMMGASTQTLPSAVAGMLPSPAPAFRGIFSLLYNGQISANNPYVKPFAFKLQRIFAGWHGGSAWYPEKAAIPVGTDTIGAGLAAIRVADPVSWSADASAVPDHQAGDTLILITKRTDGSAESPPLALSGWTTPPDGTWPTNNPEGGMSQRVQWKVDVDNSVDLITIAANEIGVLFIYRNVAVGQVATYSPEGFDTQIEAPVLGTDNPGGSWFWQVFTSTGTQVEIAPPGAPAIFDQSPNLGGGDILVTEVSTPTSQSPPGLVAQFAGSTAMSSAAIELIPQPSSQDIIAMNPAHIIYQCVTDPVWGMGYPTQAIDVDSFEAAADTLYTEGFGLCMLWSRQEELGAFIRTVLDHIGAVFYSDPKTGKFGLRLLRADYDPNALQVFNEGNVVALESFQRVGYGDTVNEITVVFRDAGTNKDTPVTVQNLANVQAQGAVVSQTRQYPGLPSASLALRVAQRDLIAASTPLAKARIVVNRSAWDLFPGDVLKLNWPKLGLVGIVFRVLGVDYGTLTDGTITVDIAEDVFGLPAGSYAAQEPPGWVEPDTTPDPVVDQAILEVPYRTLATALTAGELANLDSDAAYMSALAAKPSQTALQFSIASRVGSANFEEVGLGAFVPYAELGADIGPTDTAIALAAGVDLDTVDAGSLAIIGTGSTAEIVTVQGVDPVGLSMVVARGILDTVPAEHAAGAPVWFDDGRAAPEQIERATGETVDFKLLTMATAGKIGVGAATTVSATAARRQFRPYPPGNFKINGQAYPASASGALTITWAHRDRLQQTAGYIEQGEASIGPEGGSTYSVELRRTDTNAVVASQSGIAGTSYTPTINQAGTYPLRVQVWAVRDGVESWQRQSHTLTYTGTGLSITAQGKLLTAAASQVFPAAGVSVALALAQAAQAARAASGWRSTITLATLGGGETVGIGTVLTAQFTRYYTVGSDLFGEAIQAGITMSTPRTRAQALGDWAVIASLNETLRAYGWNIYSSGSSANPTAELFGPIGQEWDVYPTPPGTPPGSTLWGLQQSIADRGGPAIPTDTPQVVTATVSGTAAPGDIVTLTLGAATLTYVAGDTSESASTVALGLASIIDAHESFVATVDGAVVTISGFGTYAFPFAARTSGARAFGNVVNIQPDPFYDDIKFLLQFNGVDGSQSITDSGPDALTITVVGTGALSDEQSMHGGVSWKPASGSRIVVPSNAMQTGDFTIEGWIRFISVGDAYTIFTKSIGTGFYPYQLVFLTATNRLHFRGFDNTGPNLVVDIQSLATPDINEWMHFACVRQGSTFRLYIGGVQQGTASFSGTLFTNAADVTVFGIDDGAGNVYLNGYGEIIRATAACRYPDGTSFSPLLPPWATSAP